MTKKNRIELTLNHAEYESMFRRVSEARFSIKSMIDQMINSNNVEDSDQLNSISYVLSEFQNILLQSNIEEDPTNQYRRKHKRCKTCHHAHIINNYSGLQMRGWACEVKNEEYLGDIRDSGNAGCFCRYYSPRLI